MNRKMKLLLLDPSFFIAFPALHTNRLTCLCLPGSISETTTNKRAQLFKKTDFAIKYSTL